MARAWEWLHLLLRQVTFLPKTSLLVASAADSGPRDAGVNAIESLMERRGAFDYILLETSGLADPGNLAPLFWVDAGLGSAIYLDGIVVVADASNILRTLDEGDSSNTEADSAAGAPAGENPPLTTAHLQLSHADVILLNKADAVAAPELERVARRVRGINGLARIEVTTYSRVAALEGSILDLHAYDSVDALRTHGARAATHMDPVSVPLPVAA